MHSLSILQDYDDGIVEEVVITDNIETPSPEKISPQKTKLVLTEEQKQMLKNRIKELIEKEKDGPERDENLRNIEIVQALMKDLQEPTLYKTTIKSPRRSPVVKGVNPISSSAGSPVSTQSPKTSSPSNQMKSSPKVILQSNADEYMHLSIADQLKQCDKSTIEYRNAQTSLEEALEKYRKIKREWMVHMFRYKSINPEVEYKITQEDKYIIPAIDGGIVHRAELLLSRDKECFCWQGSLQFENSNITNFKEQITKIENSILDFDYMYSRIISGKE